MTTQSYVAGYPQQTPSKVAAEFCGVSKRYGPVLALNNVSFRIHRGEMVSLLGANGAGKTTAVKLLLGLAALNQGTIRIFGENPRSPGAKMRVGASSKIASSASFPVDKSSACFLPSPSAAILIFSFSMSPPWVSM